MTLTYADACRDPNLFGPWFAAPSWDTWRVLDKAIFGQPLDSTELTTFTELTGRAQAPSAPAPEVWIIAGRRAGKDVKAASIAVYLATIGAELYGYHDNLTPGERGVVQLLAVDRAQARVCLGYLKAMFRQPMLARLVERETAEGVELANRISVEITTNDQRRVRGRTVIAAIFDEVAFWRAGDSATPDEEVYTAVRPAMATIPGSMLIGISSPHARRALLWAKYKAHWGQPDPTLIVQAPTWRLNPTLPRDGEFLSGEYARDPARASAEYGADFRTDVEALLTMEAVEAVTDTDVRERAPVERTRYAAFVDPSGGSADSFTLAIAHREGDVAVIDAVRERRPPFSPEAVVDEFASLLGAYRVREVTGDRYAGEWPREQFAKRGITYRTSRQTKSELYAGLVPVINSTRVSLLDIPRLTTQLVTLERRTARGGRDSIDHPPGGHDDVANAVAGAVAAVRETRRNGLPPTGKPILVRME